MDIIPEEILVLILSYLDMMDVAMVALVSQFMHRIAHDAQIWKNIASGYRFSSLCSSNEFILQDEGLDILKSGPTESKWSTVIGCKPYNQGIHYWEMEVINIEPTGNNKWKLCVGVVNPLHPLVDTRVVGWEYIAGTGQKVKDNAQEGRGYALPYGNGDIIGVLVDIPRGRIYFYHNGINQGCAFNHIQNLTNPIYPSISFFDKGTHVRVRLPPKRTCKIIYHYMLLCVGNKNTPVVCK